MAQTTTKPSSELYRLLVNTEEVHNSRSQALSKDQREALSTNLGQVWTLQARLEDAIENENVIAGIHELMKALEAFLSEDYKNFAEHLAEAMKWDEFNRTDKPVGRMVTK